ncbi:MAG: hypothetical protein HY297_00780 [Thaumarchaeota archaeon]|nr:hypothetical protein [Nitrososphaerota archaeon]
MIQLILIFIWMMAAFIGLAFLEVTVEGDQAGGEGTKGWRRSIFGYRIKEYHFWLWFVVVPLFVFSPLVVLGFDLRTFGTLAIAYLIGGVVEDFTYFLANPHYGLSKWNRTDAKWMPWFRWGILEVPQFYVRNAAASAVVFILFIWR